MKKIPFLISILILTSCASNLPYVNTFDITKLQDGMSRTEVRNILGKPILMKSVNSEMVWEYKYRTMSNPRMRWEAPRKGDSPSKVGAESDLYCIFKDGRLVEWGSCISGCQEDIVEEEPEQELEEPKSDCESKCTIPVNCDCN